MDVVDIPFKQIVVSPARSNRRKELGDIPKLARSIEQRGLLHPLVLSSEMDLVSGLRRMTACATLGWKTVPCHIAKNLNDVEACLRAEQEENTERKELTPSEAYAMAELLRPHVEEQAAERQAAGGGKHSGSGKLPEARSGEGFTRNILANMVGVSGKQLDKISEIVEAEKKAPSRFKGLVAEMDKTGNVEAAHRKVRLAKAVEKLESVPANKGGPFDVIVIDPAAWSSDAYKGSLDLLTKLEIPAKPDCVLFLWTGNTTMSQACAVAAAWGFEQRTVFTWNRLRAGARSILVSFSQHCLVCTRGNPVICEGEWGTVVSEQPASSKPFAKPDAFYKMVDAICVGSKTEMFVAGRHPGWSGGTYAFAATDSGAARARVARTRRSQPGRHLPRKSSKCQPRGTRDLQFAGDSGGAVRTGPGN